MALDSRKIAKNTAFMYFRMALTMLIGLFSVRVVLNVLGEVDYGIYNVVGGIVTMVAFLNNSLASTTQRFLSFEIGRNNVKRLKSIFCNSLTLFILVSFILLIFAETLGLWFVNCILVIPNERIIAVNWVYQFSVISFLCSILSSPYNAVIVAHEKMNIYAYISIAESLLKLGMICSLLLINGDKLIYYGLFMTAISLASLVLYRQYCIHYYEETEYKIMFDKQIIKEIGSFAGWSVWGALSNIFKGQGINILLNLYFGPIVNASRGIAYQVEGAVNTLVQNFYTAVRPQLIKSYASDKNQEMYSLLYLSTRLGYFLMFLATLIFVFETKFILTLWLRKVPQYSIEFTRLVLISQLFIVMANPLMTAIHATGKVARYQFWSGCIFTLVFPISFILIVIDGNCFYPFYVIIVSSILYWMLTLQICHKQIDLPLKNYFLMLSKLIAISIVLICSIAVVYSLLSPGWVRFVTVSGCTIAFGCTAIFFIDCTKKERETIISLARRIKLCKGSHK